MCLPCNLDDETDCHAGILVCAAECIYDIELLIAELLSCDFLAGCPLLLACRMVIVRIFRSGPPYGVLGILIHDDVLILGRTAGEFTSENINRAKIGKVSLCVTGKVRIHFIFKQLLVGRVVDDFGSTGNAVLC